MSLTLLWTNSTPGSRQLPLKHTLIESRVSPDLPWAPVNVVAVPAQQLVLDTPPPGDWHFRATEVDTADVVSSNRRELTVNIPHDPPSGVVDFTHEFQP